MPVRGLDAIKRCRVDPSRWDAAFGGDHAGEPWVFCRETADAGHAFHARLFAPRMGVPEA